MASCESSSKFLQGWSINSIINYVLPVWCKTLSLPKWYFIYPEFKGPISDLILLSYLAQQCSPVISVLVLSHSLIHACPWLMGLMSDAGMCSVLKGVQAPAK